MNLRTYRAPSMAQALAEVKKDLGKDAVILHTRAYKVGAVMGIGGKQVIEVTAADQMSARGPSLKSGPAAMATAGKPARRPAPEEFIADAFARVEAPAAGGETPIVQVRPVKVEDLVSRTAMTLPPRTTPSGATAAGTNDSALPAPADSAKVGAALLENVYNPPAAGAPRQEVVAKPAPKAAPAASSGAPTEPPPISRLTTKVPFAPVNQSAMLELQAELASIKRLVGKVLQCSQTTAVNVAGAMPSGLTSMAGVSDPLFSLYLRLQESQVAPAIVEELIGVVRDELTSDELAEPEVVRQAMLRAIGARIPVVGSMSKPDAGRPLTIALVGPTGVGKTTTIAKLAAAYKLRQGKKVGLVTSDTYRIAAVDQLRVYANIIGLPLKVVMTPREMSAACSALADHDVILIDTAGRSQHDATRLDELQTFIEASSPHETHLMLSSTVAEPVLAKAVEKFGALSPTRVIFSKLDEAVSFGVLLNVMHARKLKVSYVTTGQEVPDQIELAQADRLARLVLDGELAR
jgi:flagellar biosynthesis protein FlhF